MTTKLIPFVAMCAMVSCSAFMPMTSKAESTVEPGGGSTTEYWQNDRWQDRVPREPMWFINAGSGLYDSNVRPEDNYQGLSVWWRGEQAVDELLVRIRLGYNIGARWFFVNRPMGSTNYSHVPAASWLTMDSTKRDQLPEQLTDALLGEFDEQVHIVWFIGSDMADPREFSGWSSAQDSRFFQIGENDTWERLVASRVTLGGWISTGASGIAIDHSARPEERNHFIKLFEQLNQFPFNLAIYGEAFPLLTVGGRVSRDYADNPVIDQQAIASMPWIGAEDYINFRWPLGEESSSFPLDIDATRMFVWFTQRTFKYGQESERISLVHSYMDRGLIPITLDPVMFSQALNRYHNGDMGASAGSESGGDNSPGYDGDGGSGPGYGNSFGGEGISGGGGGGGGSGGGGGAGGGSGGGGGGTDGGAISSQAGAPHESPIMTIRKEIVGISLVDE